MSALHGALALALAAALCLPGTALAAKVGGAVGISTQLVDRGIAVTSDTPSLQLAGYWLPAPGWSLSASASSALNAPGHQLLTTLELSRSWTLSDSWQMQAGVVRYSYPGNRINRMLNRDEVSIGGSYRDRLSVSVGAFALPDSYPGRWYGAADLTVHQPLPAHLSLSAGIGISQAPAALYGLDYANHYSYGHAGLMWNAGAWSVEIDRIFSDAHSIYTRRRNGIWPWVATLSRAF
ncbi:hypothetical protein A6R71_18080 [Xanthomonas translucens pv. arrhenatheri]|uniref:Secreted protein n=1 Tax=Xanthomonas graminis pv. arrhenatheri LMG 727 TaxID=1195923 RepID=A0A0K2ZEX1_9XANT|nr:hypothetical protein [Xanthomonas translucens]OAX66891.1 hypothetical protein A6R71_18080 [Xanthomonas translucens pv. arrhenatheri]UKE79415.1 hypothetical protein KM317_09565 [Xanthomonas translucens pv. arrhenatheri]CTP83477.1 hypothetical protein XTALMG727_0637 [Xanthomonas translucens pv. arrhenatheri LMG 727]